MDHAFRDGWQMIVITRCRAPSIPSSVFPLCGERSFLPLCPIDHVCLSLCQYQMFTKSAEKSILWEADNRPEDLNELILYAAINFLFLLKFFSSHFLQPWQCWKEVAKSDSLSICKSHLCWTKSFVGRAFHWTQFQRSTFSLIGAVWQLT